MSDDAMLSLFEDEAVLTGDPIEDRCERAALELAGRAGAAGITAADVRLYAARHGWGPSHADRQRAWSFLAPLFRRMVLENKIVATGRYRSSPIPKSHGNRHLVYVIAPYHQEPR